MKVEKTNIMIDYITNLKSAGLTVDNSIILADIAESLAMIADKLCGSERGKKSDNKKVD